MVYKGNVFIKEINNNTYIYKFVSLMSVWDPRGPSAIPPDLSLCRLRSLFVLQLLSRWGRSFHHSKSVPVLLLVLVLYNLPTTSPWSKDLKLGVSKCIKARRGPSHRGSEWMLFPQLLLQTFENYTSATPTKRKFQNTIEATLKQH